jgi:hypothetical protein
MLVPVGEDVEVDGFYRTCTADGEGAATRGINIALPPVVTTSTTMKYGAGGSYVDTPVTNDITTPANMRPLPTLNVDTTGAFVDVAAGLASLATKLDTIITNTDDLELTADNIALNADTIKLNTDDLETLATATNAKLDTLITQTDGIETSLSAIEVDVGSIDGKLPATLGQKTAAESLAVTLPSDVALPLPTGAATEATLGNVLADTTALVAKDFATETTLSDVKDLLDAVDTTLSDMAVDLDAIETGIPNTLGQKARSGSLAVTVSNEDQATLDSINTAVTAMNLRMSGSLVPVNFNTIIPNLSGATEDVYLYYLSGDLVATLTITYTDSSKSVISSIVRT